MENPNASNKYYFIIYSYYWFQAVISQGKRVIHEADRMNRNFAKIFEFSSDAKFKENYDNDRHITVMEEQFFLTALGKSIGFLKMFIEYEEIKNIIDEQIGLENITNLRNMREHDDAYIVGGGRKQEKFIFRNETRSSVADATSTNMDLKNNEYFLGERINVFAVIRLYEKLLPDVKVIKEILLSTHSHPQLF